MYVVSQTLDLKPGVGMTEAREVPFSLIVGIEEAGQRLDRLLSARFLISRARAGSWFEKGEVRVEGKPARKSHHLRVGERVEGIIPASPPAELRPQDLPLQILHQDPTLLVVNKPRGLVVHPGSGVKEGTLVNALLFHFPDLAGVGEPQRPGIVHRLDRFTSGCLVVARSDEARRDLMRQFARRRVRKEYLALVHGQPRPERGMIEAPLGRHPVARQKFSIQEGGRPALTRWRVLARLGAWSLLSLDLLTGRTHQIRVHLAALGHPVVGDPTYGRRPDPWNLKGQFLHAHKLGFSHPQDGQDREFIAPLPDELALILAELGSGQIE